MMPYIAIGSQSEWVEGALVSIATLNTGATPFAYPIPNGFIAWEAP